MFKKEKVEILLFVGNQIKYAGIANAGWIQFYPCYYLIISVRNKDLTWPEEMSQLAKNKTIKKEQGSNTFLILLLHGYLSINFDICEGICRM